MYNQRSETNIILVKSSLEKFILIFLFYISSLNRLGKYMSNYILGFVTFETHKIIL